MMAEKMKTEAFKAMNHKLEQFNHRRYHDVDEGANQASLWSLSWTVTQKDRP